MREHTLTFPPARKTIKTIAQFFFKASALFLLGFFSCANAPDVLKSELLQISRSENFSAIEKFSGGKLKKIAKLNDGSLYYLALKISESDYPNKIAIAKRLLQCGIAHYTKLYNAPCEKMYYELADLEEKIQVLESKAAQLSKDNPQQELGSDQQKFREEEAYITTKLEALYLEAGMSEKLSEPLETYLAKTKLTPQSAAAVQDIFLRNNINSAQYEKEGNAEKSLAHFYGITIARILCVRRHYGASAEMTARIISEILAEKRANDKLALILTREIISDFGRAFLSGMTDVHTAVNLFESLYARVRAYFPENPNVEQKSVLHALCFYIARFYEKLQTKEFSAAVISYYELAAAYAPNNADYDNAIWYELRFLSSNEALYLHKLKETAAQWKNAYQYEDIIAALTVRLTQKRAFERLKELLLILAPTNLSEEKAKLQYIIARFQNERASLHRVFTADQDNFYYTLMSGYYLKNKAAFAFAKQYRRSEKLDPDECAQLIAGLETFGLYSQIYPHVKTFAQNIRVADAEYFCEILRRQGLYPDSINLIQYACRSKGAQLSAKSLQLMYPRFFSSAVSKYAREYHIPEYFMYALIRCESFFKVGVSSHAGAVGLCQLMPATAADIARHLKVTDYNLIDPETNIRFAAYYLSTMLKSQGSFVKAFQAYNAGGGNVRKWNRQYGNLAGDLFVEATPFAETRNYAKKILQSACIYAQVYYGISNNQVIAEFFGF